MTKINYVVNFCAITVTLITLSVLSFFKLNDTANNIANIVFIVFMCIYVSCSFKLTASSIIISVGILIEYLGKFFSSDCFALEAVDLIYYVVLGVGCSGLLSLLYVLFAWPDGKAKIKSILLILLLIVGVAVWFLGIMYAQLEPGVISYILFIVADIFFVFTAVIASKFSLFSILEK